MGKVKESKGHERGLLAEEGEKRIHEIARQNGRGHG
jgi:hypothetical protein